MTNGFLVIDQMPTTTPRAHESKFPVIATISFCISFNLCHYIIVLRFVSLQQPPPATVQAQMLHQE